jgi:hypothetical protein
MKKSKSQIDPCLDRMGSRDLPASGSSEDPQNDIHILLELDGFSYKSRDGDPVSCDSRLKGFRSPRNSIYVNGRLFPVLVFFVSRYGERGHRLVVVPRRVERLGGCQDHLGRTQFTAIHFIVFEAQSQLNEIVSFALYCLSHLVSICIPPSVEILPESSFFWCRRLLSVSFEPGSKLVRIDSEAFSDCRSLEAIHLPASLEIMIGSALKHTDLSLITVEEGNTNFQVYDSFLMDIEGLSAVRYFGSQKSLIVNRAFEVLGPGCFNSCQSLISLRCESESSLIRIDAWAFHFCTKLESVYLPASVKVLCEGCFDACPCLALLTFESGSMLTRIEANVFMSCRSLKSIRIPRAIQTLEKDWSIGSSFDNVTFESAASLRVMIETGNADFDGAFQIRIEECDCELVFTGYTVAVIGEVHHLVKM